MKKCLDKSISLVFFSTTRNLCVNEDIWNYDVFLTYNHIYLDRLGNQETLARWTTPDMSVKINIDGNILSLENHVRLKVTLTD